MNHSSELWYWSEKSQFLEKKCFVLFVTLFFVWGREGGFMVIQKARDVNFNFFNLIRDGLEKIPGKNLYHKFLV